MAANPAAALGEGWAALEEGDAERAAHCAALVLGGDAQHRLADGSTLEAMGLVLRGVDRAPGERPGGRRPRRAEPGIGAGSAAGIVARYVLGALTMLGDDVERARMLLEDAEHRAAGALPTAYGLVLSQQALLAIEGGQWDLAETLLRRAHAQQRAAGVRGTRPRASCRRPGRLSSRIAASGSRRLRRPTRRRCVSQPCAS